MPKKILRILYKFYEWFIFVPLLGLSTLIFGTSAAILAIIVNPNFASQVCAVSWARFISFITPVFVKVTGRENLDKNKSYIIVSNHQSHYDILTVYGWLGVDFKWVMKKELRKIPALGIACEKIGHIFIDRSNPGAAVESLKEAKAKLTAGTSVMFFPEGTRSKDGKIGQFKKGAFRMAADLDLPLLPVTIKGTREILPAGTYNLFPGKAELIIHKPIEPSNYGSADIENLIEETRQAIISGMV